MKKAELEHIFKGLDKVTPMMADFMKVDLDYSEKSVLAYEEEYSSLYPVHGEFPERTSALFGKYLGDVIVRTVPGARWVFEDVPDLTSVRIVVEVDKNAKSVLMPFRRIQKFFNDRTDSPYALLMMAKRMSTMSNIENLKENEWEKFDDGTMVRFTSIPADATDEEIEELSKKMGMPISRDRFEAIKNQTLGDKDK